MLHALLERRDSGGAKSLRLTREPSPVLCRYWRQIESMVGTSWLAGQGDMVLWETRLSELQLLNRRNLPIQDAVTGQLLSLY